MNKRAKDKTRANTLHENYSVDSDRFYEDIFTRTNLLITKEDQKKLQNSTVAIIGVGGIGGIAAEMVARCGIGSIKIADIEVYEPTNLNRQLFSNFYNSYGPNRRVEDRKAQVAADRIKQLNPFCNLTVVDTGINSRNVEEFCRDCDVVILQPDRESIKAITHRICKKYSIPVITSSRTGCNGNRWTLSARVWNYKADKDLKTFEETNHAELKKYPLSELTDEILADYDARDKVKVRGRWGNIIKEGKSKEFGLIGQEDAEKVMEENPDMFHKMHIIAPIANIAGAMASVKAFKLILNHPVRSYGFDLFNGVAMDLDEPESRKK